LLKLYVAIDEDLKALQPQLDAKQLPHDLRGRMPAAQCGRGAPDPCLGGVARAQG
jgi:hypothetical protein